jgi:BarA-like signal transduction histidine kinase
LGGIGIIRIESNRDVASYVIQDMKSITDVIITHFDSYPLQSAKKIDYELWKQCVSLITNKEHLTQDGLEKIVSIKSALNLGLPDKLKEAFPRVVPLVRPNYSP